MSYSVSDSSDEWGIKTCFMLKKNDDGCCGKNFLDCCGANPMSVDIETGSKKSITDIVHNRCYYGYFRFCCPGYCRKCNRYMWGLFILICFVAASIIMPLYSCDLLRSNSTSAMNSTAKKINCTVSYSGGWITVISFFLAFLIFIYVKRMNLFYCKFEEEPERPGLSQSESEPVVETEESIEETGENTSESESLFGRESDE